MRSAVLFLVFNRPDTTRQVFQAIRAAKPPRLYVAADGPRQTRMEEGLCEDVRSIATQVDWPCEVNTLFRNENLGCKRAVSSAIAWFFEREVEGIVLEDDCLPSISFFAFADQLLERYREDERVFLVSGYNKQDVWDCDGYDYFFSNYGGIWGWASWRRAWKYYDRDMTDLEDSIRKGVFENLLGAREAAVRVRQLREVKEKNVDTWDYQWGFARHKNNGLSCVPRKSLVKNIGFGKDATHTVGENQDGVEAHEMDLPLKENPYVVPDRRYDSKFFGARPTLRQRLLNGTRRMIKDLGRA